MTIYSGHSICTTFICCDQIRSVIVLRRHQLGLVHISQIDNVNDTVLNYHSDMITKLKCTQSSMVTVGQPV